MDIAVGLGYGEELSRGLAVLHRENKGTMINDPLWSAYHHSHPPVLDRIRAIAQRKEALKGDMKQSTAYAALRLYCTL